jgi:hypothetical protein
VRFPTLDQHPEAQLYDLRQMSNNADMRSSKSRQAENLTVQLQKASFKTPSFDEINGRNLNNPVASKGVACETAGWTN